MEDLYDKAYWTGETSNYGGYGDDPGWVPSSTLLKSMLEPDAKVLEVACAHGYFVRRARRDGIDARGIDISKYAIEHAPDEVRQWVVHGDAADLPYADQEFDAVVSWEFLEHVPKEHLGQVLHEMDRVAKPGAWQVHRICLPGSDDDDHTHVTIEPREWWNGAATAMSWAEVGLWIAKWNVAFTGRDWSGRYFVWRG